LETTNLIIKIKSRCRDNESSLGKKRDNIATVVSNFKDKRLKELTQVINNSKDTSSGLKLCAITGVTGIGKSELAKAYASKLPDSQGIFRWRLDPDSDPTSSNSAQVSYQQAYAMLLYNFDLGLRKAYASETPDQVHLRVKETLWQRIDEYPTWIIIFDNASSYDDIRHYLPTTCRSKGLILVTSQKSIFCQ
jgi:energy-coupling factor transporter ATP-binding protein EcfA2